MPMMMALALLAQTGTLEADPHAAALTCGGAVTEASGGLSKFPSTVVIFHFALLGARTSAEDKPFPDKLTGAMVDLVRRSKTLDGPLEPLLRECRARFPQAWNNDRVTLPSNAYDRKFVCMSAVGMLMGIGGRTDPDPQADHAKALGDRWRALLDAKDHMAAGVRPDGMPEKMASLIYPMLDQGNLLAMVRSCEVVFPA